MIRIATWNLERPRDREPRRAPFLTARLTTVAADVWVLTETNEAISPGPGFRAVSTPSAADGDPGERMVMIWSRFPLRPVDLEAAGRTVAAEVLPADGPPLVVVGIVIPYHADRGPEGRSRAWEEHHRAIPAYGAEWTRLRREYPGHAFIVAGDFNQSRDGRPWWGKRQWYGTHAGRAALTEALRGAGLTCVTEEDFVATGQLAAKSSIDHVALDSQVARRVRRVGAWEAGAGQGGVRLSDHNGVWVDLAHGAEGSTAPSSSARP